jgi:hypothetical protein
MRFTTALQPLLSGYPLGVKHLVDLDAAVMQQMAAGRIVCQPRAAAGKNAEGIGSAVANFLSAAHALGFAGKMRSDDKALSPQPIAIVLVASGATPTVARGGFHR